MGANYSLYLIAALVFLLGVAAGWLLATIRANVRIGITLSPRRTGALGAIATGSLSTRKARVLEIKCACGTVMKFRDPPEAGFLPYPGGDTVTCASCGRAQDMSEIRKLQGDAGA